MGILSAYMSVHHSCAWYPWGYQKRALDLLEVGLQTVVICSVGPVLLAADPFLQPLSVAESSHLYRILNPLLSEHLLVFLAVASGLSSTHSILRFVFH